MFIEPNTDIRLLHGCPLDPEYVNTILFENATAQTAYFISLTKYNLSAQTYQRHTNGTARVSIPAENLFDCNYMMFKNTSFENKWFYAFIEKVEYINNITSEITFSIDVMQSWMFDFEVNDVFVEREHSVTDEFGENLVEENLDLGEYIINTEIRPPVSDLYFIVACTFNEAGNYSEAHFYSGLPTGLKYYKFSSIDALTSFLQSVINNNLIDGVVSITVAPMKYLDDVEQESDMYHYNWQMARQVTLDGYAPRNNKLLSYPYNFLYVTNNQGNSAIYRWEFFNTSLGHISLTIDACVNACTEAMVYPNAYKGVADNVDEKMILSGFPQIAFSIDAFRAWVAQNAVPTLLQIGTSWGASIAGIATDNFLAGATGLIGITNAVSKVHQAYIQPPQAKGSSNGTVLSASGNLTFVAYNKSITKEFAQIIDDYFDRFGYATHRVKKPNMNSRPHWNYVKTIECSISGSVPSDDEKTICNIFDKGITFWKNGDEIGNYSLDNRP